MVGCEFSGRLENSDHWPWTATDKAKQVTGNNPGKCLNLCILKVCVLHLFSVCSYILTFSTLDVTCTCYPFLVTSKFQIIVTFIVIVNCLKDNIKVLCYFMRMG